MAAMLEGAVQAHDMLLVLRVSLEQLAQDGGLFLTSFEPVRLVTRVSNVVRSGVGEHKENQKRTCSPGCAQS